MCSRSRGVAKGDPRQNLRPMIPEANYAMLACAPGRGGAFRWCSGLLAGFVASRHHRCEIDVLITADEGLRGGERADQDERGCACGQGRVETGVVVKRNGLSRAACGPGANYNQRRRPQSADCPARRWAREDRLHSSYTRADRHAQGGAAQLRAANLVGPR